MGITSYAQNFEDVMLSRAFPGASGFYVDVGANDPDIDSVSRTFYERGWSGINLEPLGPQFERLKLRRPRDVNLQIAVGEAEGETRSTHREMARLFPTHPAIVAQHRPTSEGEGNSACRANACRRSTIAAAAPSFHEDRLGGDRAALLAAPRSASRRRSW